MASGIVVSRGGDGDFLFGDSLAAAGSSRVALALKEKFQEVIITTKR